MQNLKALLEKLINSEVDFVLVGGFASVVHGSTQVTQDLDICAAMTDETLVNLRTALKDLNPKHRMNPSFKASFLENPKSISGVNNIYLETDLGVLDILSNLPPVGDFSIIKSHSVKIPLFGKTCRVISIEDLIAIKESLNRPKDIQATQELKLIQLKNSKGN